MQSQKEVLLFRLCNITPDPNIIFTSQSVDTAYMEWDCLSAKNTQPQYNREVVSYWVRRLMFYLVLKAVVHPIAAGPAAVLAALNDRCCVLRMASMTDCRPLSDRAHGHLVFRTNCNSMSAEPACRSSSSPLATTTSSRTRRCSSTPSSRSQRRQAAR